MKKSIDLWEITYLVLYGLLLIRDFFDTTMFIIPWPVGIMRYLYLAIIIYVIAKMIFHRTYTIPEYLLSFVILLTFSVSAVVSGYIWLVGIGFLIVGAKDVNIDNILKVYLVIGSVILIAAFIASQCGFIENLVYLSETKGSRQSFGIIYPTDFAAHVFYLILAGVCIKNRKISIWSILVVLCLDIFLLKACAAYTSFICIGLFLVAMICIKLSEHKEKASAAKAVKWKYALCGTPVVYCGIFFMLSIFFDEDNHIWYVLDQLLSIRLQLSQWAIKEYGFTLFGQMIPENGNGGSIAENESYFFLDDSYMRIALLYGLVLLIVVLLLMVLSKVRAVRADRMTLFVAMLVVAIHCVMEHHLLESAYNPFIFCVFAALMIGKSRGGTHVSKD